MKTDWTARTREIVRHSDNPRPDLRDLVGKVIQFRGFQRMVSGVDYQTNAKGKWRQVVRLVPPPKVFAAKVTATQSLGGGKYWGKIACLSVYTVVPVAKVGI